MKILNVIQKINLQTNKFSKQQQYSRPQSHLSYQQKQRNEERELENQRLYGKIQRQIQSKPKKEFKTQIQKQEQISFNISQNGRNNAFTKTKVHSDFQAI